MFYRMSFNFHLSAVSSWLHSGNSSLEGCYKYFKIPSTGCLVFNGKLLSNGAFSSKFYLPTAHLDLIQQMTLNLVCALELPRPRQTALTRIPWDETRTLVFKKLSQMILMCSKGLFSPFEKMLNFLGKYENSHRRSFHSSHLCIKLD